MMMVGRATIGVTDVANRAPYRLNPIPDVRISASTSGENAFFVELETVNSPIFTDDDTNGPSALAGAQTLTYSVSSDRTDVVRATMTTATIAGTGSTRLTQVRLVPGSRIINASSSAIVTVTASDAGGLTATATFNYSASGIVSVQQQNQLTGVSVYPNPVADFVTVTRTFERAGDVTITITNVLGQRVFAKATRAIGQFTETISTDNLQSGMYFLEVMSNGQRHVEKIVKR
jgi:hypothetical protein